MDFPNVVIGSGPAGISCAMALLAHGQRVLMIDGGSALEPEREERLRVLQEQAPDEWVGSTGAWLKEGMAAAVEGIPLKLSYGSEFPYRAMPGAPRIEGEGVNTKFSLCKGGLSTVWGSAVMPYCQHDLNGWPITANDLAPHYKAVLDFMPIAQGTDRLAARFPIFRETQPLPASPQAAALLADMESNATQLANAGVTFGHSRLAVNGTGSDAGLQARTGCVRCGLCMYGCPYGLIYSTAQTVDMLRGNPDFQYVPGHVVQRIVESVGTVILQTQTIRGPEVLTAERVFVAAGVLPTTALMLRSLDAYDQTVQMKESHYFLLPMLRLRGLKDFKRGDLHTLAQAFLEIDDPDLSPYMIHLQTYTYNDLFDTPIAEKLGPLAPFFPWSAFLSRLYLFQGYLHSDHSSTIAATLRRDSSGDAMHLVPTTPPVTADLRKKLVRKLNKLASLTGLRPLSPLMRPGEPGRGFHTAGSFPMQQQPSGLLPGTLVSDTLGRVGSLKRVHVVDSSILPSVPATTITFTVMANAHRIGSLVAQGAAS